MAGFLAGVDLLDFEVAFLGMGVAFLDGDVF